MSNDKPELYSIVSKGEVVEGFNSNQVIGKLQKQFKINEQQALKVLKKGFILKNNLTVSQAKKICNNLLKFGLVTGFRPVRTSSKAPIQLATSNNRPQSSSTSKIELEKIFYADIPREPAKMGYKAGLIAVASLSLLAPIIYFGLILSLVYGVYSYMAALPQILNSIGSTILKVLVAIIPPFVASVLILFMTKPLFTRRKHWRGFEIKPEQAPGLFSLVKIMCDRINVPVPISIYVDNYVNASAGSAAGLFALLRGQLVLTVGMPLVSGMNARQLVGILAHEFGHFAQPSAMFTYYLINTVNHWFADRAFHHDSWDDRLENWERRSENFGWAYIAIMLAKLGIGITRKLFKLLYYINLRTTRFMSRHMEYDADRYEALIAGSEHFRENAILLRVLSEASNIVANTNLIAWDQNKLLKNIPDAIATQSKQLNRKTLQNIEIGMQQEDSNWWDSHPPDNDRIDHAQAHDYKAIFSKDYPAALFFKDFNTLCNNVTLYNYRANGIEQPEQYIIENQQVLKLKETHEKTYKALDSYFNDSFSFFRMMSLNETTNSKLARLDLQTTIDWLRRHLVKFNKNQETYYTLNKRYQVMALGKCYIEAAIDIEFKEFYLNNSNLENIEQLKSAELTRLHKIQQQQEQVDALFYQRILLALKTMSLQQQQRCNTLLSVIQDISRLNETMRNLNHVLFVLDCLLSYEQEQQEQQTKLTPVIIEQTKFCVQDIGMLLRASEKITDLIETSKDKKLKEFILSYTGKLPEKLLTLTSWQVVEVSHKTLNAIQYQYVWLCGELVTLCEAQESALGILPIKLLLMPKNKNQT